MTPQALLNKYPIITDQVEKAELEIILAELSGVLDKNIPGDIVEFGCYAGTTSLFLQRMILNSARSLHVYDSFVGLPEKTAHDNSPLGIDFVKGKLAASKQDFIRNFKKADLPLPKIHKAWFDELSQKDIPKPIAFAFLDGDYYESIKTSLKLIEPSLSPGSAIVIDDYINQALPGAKLAVDEWLTTRHGCEMRAQNSLAIIKYHS